MSNEKHVEKLQKWRKKHSVFTNCKAGSEARGPGSYTGTAQSRTAVVLETQRKISIQKDFIFQM